MNIHDYTHIRNNRQNGHRVEDFLPRSDVSGLGCHWSPELCGELPGIHPDLQDVVAQSQEGSQGERGHEQSDETKLDDWNGRACEKKMKMFKKQTNKKMSVIKLD